MSRHLGLKTRVKRRVKRLGRRKPLPTIIMAIHPAENPGEPIGYEGAGVRIERADLEPLEALRKRAAREIPSRFIRALYGPSVGILEPIEPAKPAPVNTWPTFDRSQPEAWQGWRAFAEERIGT